MQQDPTSPNLKEELTKMISNINLEKQENDYISEQSEMMSSMKNSMTIMTIALVFTASFCFVMMCALLYVATIIVK